jgi:hypothetical protein
MRAWFYRVDVNALQVAGEIASIAPARFLVSRMTIRSADCPTSTQLPLEPLL